MGHRVYKKAVSYSKISIKFTTILAVTILLKDSINTTDFFLGILMDHFDNTLSETNQLLPNSAICLKEFCFGKLIFNGFSH